MAENQLYRHLYEDMSEREEEHDGSRMTTTTTSSYQSLDATAMNGLLDIVVANLNGWQGQACVLVTHVAVDNESQEDYVTVLMEARLNGGGEG